MIVTRVPPGNCPCDGRSAVIVGMLDAAVPNEKQFGRARTTGVDRFVPSVRVICVGVFGAVSSGNCGVWTVTVLAATSVTSPSFVMPFAVNCTREVAGVPKKRPPLSVIAAGALGSAKLGWHDDTKGSVP